MLGRLLQLEACRRHHGLAVEIAAVVDLREGGGRPCMRVWGVCAEQPESADQFEAYDVDEHRELQDAESNAQPRLLDAR